MLRFLGIVAVVLLTLLAIWWIIKHLKGIIKVVLILVLCLLALGLIADPSGAAALGWFLFSLALLALAIMIISFLKG